jgi:hypothetical protein
MRRHNIHGVRLVICMQREQLYVVRELQRGPDWLLLLLLLLCYPVTCSVVIGHAHTVCQPR